MSDDEDDVPLSHYVDGSVEMRGGSLGNEVAKDFGVHGVFHGVVVEYDCEGGDDGTEEHYHVEWEDGDEEDLSPLEYRAARVKWRRLQSDGPGAKSSGVLKKKKRPPSKVGVGSANTLSPLSLALSLPPLSMIGT